MIAVVMLYISMVLIGRRHWGGREEDESMWAHYLARTLGLVALAIGVNLFFSHHNGLRADITSEKLNSLSPRTVELVKELRERRQGEDDQDRRLRQPAGAGRVRGPQAELALDALGAELAQRRQDRVDVHEIENFSEEATQRREGVRHRAARGADDRPRRAQDGRDLPRAPRSPPAWTAS